MIISPLTSHRFSSLRSVCHSFSRCIKSTACSIYLAICYTICVGNPLYFACLIIRYKFFPSFSKTRQKLSPLSNVSRSLTMANLLYGSFQFRDLSMSASFLAASIYRATARITLIATFVSVTVSRASTTRPNVPSSIRPSTVYRSFGPRLLIYSQSKCGASLDRSRSVKFGLVSIFGINYPVFIQNTIFFKLINIKNVNRSRVPINGRSSFRFYSIPNRRTFTTANAL